ncbi:Fic family protein [Thiorhodococcus mannitoliphagus]|uniref:Protein adenylyltransferase n=1 Tax=Thiorhodococcus mannitoliphagus TaxID=329406 RepID=A0A6P1E2C6_9GAMM|nr:Fic family protein [Thiorhodococcus mannitoliphagus]NEX22164.1 Fic family protein [Thiorhodococcus mannitoliphagus]
MLEPTYALPRLPPPVELETVPVLRALTHAHRALAELKGRAATIPNPGILIDTLVLQEAKASSEIENIVTTQDELFQADLFPEGPDSPAAKEVARYRDALKLGFNRLLETDGLIPNNTLIDMYRLLKRRQDGFRNTPGTALKNDRTGEVVYVPPQDARDVVRLMTALERFVNDDQASALDPLIKMALIHHQFESIHPFPDGNGRIGRILNVLYLVRTGLLETPILYLSRHITRNKSDYYRLLQDVRVAGAWEPWLLYMLAGVTETAQTTLTLVKGIREQMAGAKQRIRNDLPKLYSQDLLNNLFRHPYTRIELLQRDLGVTRQTAAKYLDALAEHQILTKHQAGRSNYFINTRLVELFLQVSECE